MKPILILTAIVLALIAGGCKGSRESQIAGTWKATQGPAMLVLKEDKSFSMGAAGNETKGKWSLNGNNVLLSPETFSGKTKAEALKQVDDMVKNNPAAGPMAETVKKTLEGMTMAVSEDNKKGTIDIAGGQMKIEFVKEPSK
ncbi:MAG: hypothetical protein ACAH95_15980 [Fimbriimonas sp.]